MPGIIGKAGWDLLRACIWDFVRHEAPHHRMEVEGLHRRSVAAGR
jgi:hypothetical protein